MTEVAKVSEQETVQSRLERLEQAIGLAHNLVDKILPRTEDSGNPFAEGIDACLSRCQQSISWLNERLSTLAGTIGTL